MFDLGFAKIGVYICYDRHFPEGARALGLNGAEIVFNPSATVAGLSEYLWKLEQPAHAVANGYFIGAINRVGTEAPWNIGEFYGSSYFCDPRGRIFAQASRDHDEVLTADLDLDMIARSAQDLAVLPRPPARHVRIAGESLVLSSECQGLSDEHTGGKSTLATVAPTLSFMRRLRYLARTGLPRDGP